MKRQRLAQLIETLQAGKLSRNKHFDAHRDPEVQEARVRQLRLNALAELLVQDEDGMVIEIEPCADGSSWILKLSAQKWRLRWQAKLLDVEVDWLKNHPPIETCMAELLATG